ncbi:MAG: alpha-glucosidase [Lachnospiraceae bacterium]|nr:alpha-glucosidase [Lachnospiraceae bacterium]
MTSRTEEGSEEKWYHRASLYQIWIRSFADGNGDGIGDLYGVYGKLDYIASLGVDAIWFSPIYPSPNADYGYDISDYRNIHPDYGDLDQFDRVLHRAHELGLKIIMDLVINHTSDEHPWFLESKKGEENPYRDYYIWRKKPNNWNSFFGGSAWEYEGTRDQYYLHLFARKQPDLNMDNPRVREEIKGIIRFWLDRGVDGFRMDVINFISKREGLPDGIPWIPAVNGVMHFKDGPHLREYLSEFRAVCREYGDIVQIGEGPLTSARTARSYIAGEHPVMDMMISFDHMMADCLFTEYLPKPFSLVSMKKAMTRWQMTMADGGWNSLYLENHDHPRIISRYGSESHWKESGKALAVSYLFQKGTPFVYQGQEIGMTNIRFRSIREYLDIASIENFERFFTGQPMHKRLNRIHHSSRDSARTPMQWDGSEYAGFSRTEPWFSVNPNYHAINVAIEEQDPDSILQFYRLCLALRKKSRTLLWGEYREYYPRDDRIFTYTRSLGKNHYLILCSLSRLPSFARIPEEYRGRTARLVLSDQEPLSRFAHLDPAHYEREKLPGVILFRPYEARVYQVRFG